MLGISNINAKRTKGVKAEPNPSSVEEDKVFFNVYY